MQNFAQTPVFCDVLDWYGYTALVNGQTRSTDITIAVANGGAKAYITLDPDQFFLFCGWVVQTNYDSTGGVFASASSNGVISQPQTPNSFLVEIQRGSVNNYVNILQASQAELASSGMLSGKQNPYPVIYGPSQTLQFTFTDLTGLHLLTQANAAISLVIHFGMVGYIFEDSPEAWLKLQQYYPGLARAYQQ